MAGSNRMGAGTSRHQQQNNSIENIARLLLKFDALEKFRQNLTGVERVHLLQQMLSHQSITVQFLDRLGATSTSPRILRLFVDVLQFRQQLQRQHGSNASATANTSVDFDELLNLVEVFDKANISRPCTEIGISNFLRWVLLILTDLKCRTSHNFGKRGSI